MLFKTICNDRIAITNYLGKNMGSIELYVIIASSLGLLLSLFTYFGMHPRRIQFLTVNFARFMQRRPRVIAVVLFAVILVNLIVLGFRIGQFSGILIGITSAVTGALIVILIEFAIRVTVGKVITSKDIQLLAVISSRFHGISELPDKVKIVTTSYGPPAQWLETALETYGTSFVPVIVAASEIFEALRRGVVDAVLIRGHPSTVLKEPVKSGMVRLLPWSYRSVEAVTKAFPTATRPARLPPNTYEGQSAEEIQGYAPY